MYSVRWPLTYELTFQNLTPSLESLNCLPSSLSSSLKSWQTQSICQEVMLKSAGRFHGGAALIYDGSNPTMQLAPSSAHLVLASQTGKCSLIRGCFFSECQNKTFAFQRDTDYLLAIISLENPLFQEIVFSLFTSESLHTAFQDVTKVRANYLHCCHMSIDTLQLSI